MAILEVKDINVSYGNLHVLWDINLKIEEGKIVALLGANGAGKTTLLNAITGMLKPTSGEVLFKGERIDNLSPDKIILKGISYLPEGGHLFPDMTITENLEMGAYPSKLWGGRKADLERMYKLFPILGERKNQLSRTMSGGERQMLAMGRALMSKPKLMMMDEPSMGLSPILVREIFSIIKEINKQGVTILLVEQNASMALSIADRAYVMEIGSIVMEGPASELLDNEDVKRAYLGS